MPKSNNFDFQNVKRVVVKVGSNVLTEPGGLNLRAIRSVSRQICNLIDNGVETILVSSGAMASGLKKIGLDRRPDDIAKRQAIAAAGQSGLIMEYETAFERYGNKVAQILMTGDDLNNRIRYLNARNTLYTLLEWRVVPIINENDTVSVKEINLGDNDNLAAMITLMVNADILISLTDINGLYNKDPRTEPDAELIPSVETITEQVEKLASSIPGPLGRGGMQSKIKAAAKVTAAGIPMIIANGTEPDILPRLFEGSKEGTFFQPKARKLASRKCWIGYSARPEGLISIDQGAALALVKNGKSLLPSGIIDVQGDFGVGAPVELKSDTSQKNRETVLGSGLVNYSAADIRQIMGLKSGQIQARLGYKPYNYVIHRDNLVIKSEG
ncbi:glutamate 5-kinase [Desulfococcaceae bacterium HSG9]|nr:glutamate 5-kinase [Desulfococcaceae bacterium HSG9]